MMAPGKIVRNAVLQWVALAFQLTASVALTPLLVRALGATGYGIVVLLAGVASWAQLLSAGLGPTLVRSLAAHHATGDARARDETASTVFAAYLGAGAVCMTAALALAPHLGRVFHLAPRDLGDARVLLLALAAAVSVQFPGSVYGAVLMARERYDLVQAVGLALLALRTAATVTVVLRWPSAALVGAVTAGSMGLEQLAYFVLARRLEPDLRVSLRLARRARLRSIGGFSAQVLVITLSERLIHATDEAVTASALGPAPVTDYALALRMVDYPRDALERGADVALPRATAAFERGDLESLRALWSAGSRALLALAVPAAWMLALWGEAVLTRWLGGPHGARGKVVAALLAAALVASVAGRVTARPILQACGDLRAAVRVTALEGAANLSLSLVLVRVVGIEGVALGTLVPAVVAGFFAMPRLVGARLGVTWARWLREVLAPALLASPPTVAALYAMRAAGLDRTLPTIALAGALTLVVHAATCWWLLASPGERAAMRAWVARRRAP